MRGPAASQETRARLPPSSKSTRRRHPEERGQHRDQEGLGVATAGAGGGSSRAFSTDWKPTLLWDPSQNGLFWEFPQRQREITVRPAKPNAFPSASQIVKSPSIRSGPLFRTVIFAAIFPPQTVLDSCRASGSRAEADTALTETSLSEISCRSQMPFGATPKLSIPRSTATRDLRFVIFSEQDLFADRYCQRVANHL